MEQAPVLLTILIAVLGLVIDRCFKYFRRIRHSKCLACCAGASCLELDMDPGPVALDDSEQAPEQAHEKAQEQPPRKKAVSFQV